MYADVVINHSPHLKEKDFISEIHTKFALGTDYALLRPNFLKAAKENRKNKKIDTVFVCFGGADKFDLTKTTTEVLLKLKNIKRINIVLGAAYEREPIFKLREKNSDRICIYKNLSEIELIKVMKSCNFAIVPCSTILFELFCLKIPIYSGFFVDNQEKAYYAFKKNNVIYGDGNLTEINSEKMIRSLKLIISSSETNGSGTVLNQDAVIDGKQQARHLKIINQLT